MEKEDDLSTPPLLPSSSGSGRDVLELPRIRACAYDGPSFRTTSNDEDEKRIPKEEAVCRICFQEFVEDNAFQVDCQCPATLIHENCEIVWSRERGNNKCEFCEFELGKTPVALIPVKECDQPTKRQKANKWKNFFTKG